MTHIADAFKERGRISKKPPYDEIGCWSEIKLDIVREYATAYSTIMSAQKPIRRHVYIDAFAGFGMHLSKTTRQFVAGSPLNALLVQPPFSEFHFIDLNEIRVAALEEIAGNRVDVTVHHGDCNQVLIDEVFPRCNFGDFARGLCLLDPYSLNVDWKVLATAGAMKTIEIFYNFMIMDANMNVLWKNPNDVRPDQIARMERVWGDASWREAAYRKERGLFGDIEEKASNDQVVRAFQTRLREVAGFEYVPDPLPMRNTTGAVVYYLFFASPNKTGGKIVTQIFDKYRSRV